LTIEDELTDLLNELLVNADMHVARPYREACDHLVAVRAGHLPFDPQKFTNDIASLVEVALSWKQLANVSAHNHFRDHCKTRVSNSSNYLGTVFELLIAFRIALSGAKCDWAEDRRLIANHRGSVVDFLINGFGETVAVECTTRNPKAKIDLKHIQQAIYVNRPGFSGASVI